MIENLNQTAQDARFRLGLARLGSLVQPNGAKLDGTNLPYLRTLRAELHCFSDAVLVELNRIERVSGGDCECCGAVGQLFVTCRECGAILQGGR